MQLLREASPPLDPRCKWSEVRARLAGDPRIDALPPEQCALMFAVYIEALAKVEEASQAAARTSFLVSLRAAPSCCSRAGPRCRRRVETTRSFAISLYGLQMGLRSLGSKDNPLLWFSWQLGLFMGRGEPVQFRAA